MTTEAFVPPTPITIATAGPHAMPFPYNAGAIRASVESLLTGVITELTADTDFTVTPSADETGGNLTLTTPAFTDHLGKKLHITRETPEQQGWAAVQGAREKGMERQLDRLTRRLQEVSRLARAAVRSTLPGLKPFVPQIGRVILFDSNGQPTNGPNAADIAQAQSNAAAAAASAATANANKIGAQTAEANAQAWAGTVNSIFLQTSSRVCVLGGTANAITLTTGGSVVSVVTGQRFRAFAASANTGAATLQIDAVSPVAIQTLAGVAVPATHWTAGQELEFTYDGAAWRVEPIGLYDCVAAIAEDRKTAGTEGGTFSGTTDVQRALNTLALNRGGLATLAANRLTLLAGRYRFDWEAPAFECVAHQTWLRNFTAGVEVNRGSYEIMASVGQTNSRGAGEAVIAVSSAFEILHRCSTTRNTDGLGKASLVIPPPYQVFAKLSVTPLKP